MVAPPVVPKPPVFPQVVAPIVPPSGALVATLMGVFSRMPGQIDANFDYNGQGKKAKAKWSIFEKGIIPMSNKVNSKLKNLIFSLEGVSGHTKELGWESTMMSPDESGIKILISQCSVMPQMQSKDSEAIIVSNAKLNELREFSQQLTASTTENVNSDTKPQESEKPNSGITRTTGSRLSSRLWSFYAGGDIKALSLASRKEQFRSTKPPGSKPSLSSLPLPLPSSLMEYFEQEYYLIHALGMASRKQPQISIWNGVVMGGGVGISMFGPYRIATERTIWAMPDVAIGLLPDVGSTWILPCAILPWQRSWVIHYTLLTGHRLQPDDLLYTGFATHYVPSQDLPQLQAALVTATTMTLTTIPATNTTGCDSKTSTISIDPIIAPVLDSFDQLLSTNQCFFAQHSKELQQVFACESAKSKGDTGRHSSNASNVDNATTTVLPSQPPLPSLQQVVGQLKALPSPSVLGHLALETLARVFPMSLIITWELRRRCMLQATTNSASLSSSWSMARNLQLEYYLAEQLMKQSTSKKRLETLKENASKLCSWLVSMEAAKAAHGSGWDKTTKAASNNTSTTYPADYQKFQSSNVPEQPSRRTPDKVSGEWAPGIIGEWPPDAMFNGRTLDTQANSSPLIDSRSTYTFTSSKVGPLSEMNEKIIGEGMSDKKTTVGFNRLFYTHNNNRHENDKGPVLSAGVPLNDKGSLHVNAISVVEKHVQWKCGEHDTGKTEKGLNHDGVAVANLCSSINESGPKNEDTMNGNPSVNGSEQLLDQSSSCRFSHGSSLCQCRAKNEDVVQEKVGEKDKDLFHEFGTRMSKPLKSGKLFLRAVGDLDEVGAASPFSASHARLPKRSDCAGLTWPIALHNAVDCSRSDGPIDLDKVYDEWISASDNEDVTVRQSPSVQSGVSPKSMQHANKVVPKLKATMHDTSPINNRAQRDRMDKFSRTARFLQGHGAKDIHAAMSSPSVSHYIYASPEWLLAPERSNQQQVNNTVFRRVASLGYFPDCENRIKEQTKVIDILQELAKQNLKSLFGTELGRQNQYDPQIRSPPSPDSHKDPAKELPSAFMYSNRFTDQLLFEVSVSKLHAPTGSPPSRFTSKVGNPREKPHDGCKESKVNDGKNSSLFWCGSSSQSAVHTRQRKIAREAKSRASGAMTYREVDENSNGHLSDNHKENLLKDLLMRGEQFGSDSLGKRVPQHQDNRVGCRKSRHGNDNEEVDQRDDLMYQPDDCRDRDLRMFLFAKGGQQARKSSGDSLSKVPGPSLPSAPLEVWGSKAHGLGDEDRTCCQKLAECVIPVIAPATRARQHPSANPTLLRDHPTAAPTLPAMGHTHFASSLCSHHEDQQDQGPIDHQHSLELQDMHSIENCSNAQDVLPAKQYRSVISDDLGPRTELLEIHCHKSGCVFFKMAEKWEQCLSRKSTLCHFHKRYSIVVQSRFELMNETPDSDCIIHNSDGIHCPTHGITMASYTELQKHGAIGLANSAKFHATSAHHTRMVHHL